MVADETNRVSRRHNLLSSNIVVANWMLALVNGFHTGDVWVTGNVKTSWFEQSVQARNVYCEL